MASAATISECGRYRYTLHRWWGDGDRLYFVMLNPSTADAEVDDPTIRRCVGFARTLGFDGITVVNLYAYRATKPADLWLADEPTGGERNDDILREVGHVAKHQTVIAAWGANARPDRVAQVTTTPGWDCVKALGVTKDGAPRHPLYLRADSVPEPWSPCGRTSHHVAHDTATGRCPGHTLPPVLPADQTKQLADTARQEIHHA